MSGSVVLALMAVSPQAHAQSASLSPRQLNAGYDRQPGSEQRPVDAPGRDGRGNRVIINGLMSQGTGLSGGLSGQEGADGLSSGLFEVNAQAVANQINVVAGSWNTIIVTATQVNTGAVSAQAAADGGETRRAAK